MTDYMPEQTIRYKTYLKNTMVSAFDDVFKNHVDPGLRNAKSTIEFPKTEADYPAVIVRFFERNLVNAGVGHTEVLTFEDDEGRDQHFKFKHIFYSGDIEFAVYALSSYDRDLMADSIVQTVMMGTLQAYTNRFYEHVNPDTAYQDLHFITVNRDTMQGFGESQQRVDWYAEDEILYMTSYRTAVFGEVYSLPPHVPFEFIKKVFIYPYIEDQEPVPEGLPTNHTDWQP